MFGSLLQYLPQTVQRLGLAIAMIMAWGIPTLSRLRPRHDNMPILLDLTTTQAIPIWTILFALIGAMLVIATMISSELGFPFFAWGLLWMTLPFNIWIQNKIKTLATEEGIFIGRSGYRWAQMRRYHWAGVRGKWRPLALQIKGRPPLFDTAVMFIPLQHVEACQVLLMRYVTDSQLPASNHVADAPG